MKKIAFSMLAFILISLGCTEPDDLYQDNMSESQLKSADTRTYQAKFTEDGYFTPLICDGEIIDEVQGLISSHWRVHYKNGVRQWIIINFSGTLTSSNGEVLTIKETDKIRYEEGLLPVYTVRWNIKGEDGSHYIGYGYVNWLTWEVVAEKTVCPPSSD